MSMNKSSYFKSKKVYYSQVSNTALRDKNLSLKAKGLYSLIQSYITIENFTLYKNMLIGQGSDGEFSFQGAWDELKENGYLIQEKKNTDKGWVYEYDLLDEPVIKEPIPRKSRCGKPGSIISTDYNNTNNIKASKNNFDGKNIKARTSKDDTRNSIFTDEELKARHEVFDYFTNAYKYYLGEEHPLYKKELLNECFNNLEHFFGIYKLSPRVKDIKVMIEDFFEYVPHKGKAGNVRDLHFALFCSDGILQIRAERLRL